MRLRLLPVFLAGLFSLTAPVLATDPTGLAYTPEGGWAGSDGVIYLLESETNEIFRWNTQTRAYLPSIPLPEPCRPIAVHSPRGPNPGTTTFLITAVSGKVLQYFVSGSTFTAEAPLAEFLPGEIEGLSLLGQTPDVLVSFRNSGSQYFTVYQDSGPGIPHPGEADWVESDWITIRDESQYFSIGRLKGADSTRIGIRNSVPTPVLGTLQAHPAVLPRLVASALAESVTEDGTRLSQLYPAGSVGPITDAVYFDPVWQLPLAESSSLITMAPEAGVTRLKRFPLLNHPNPDVAASSALLPGVPHRIFRVGGNLVSVILQNGIPSFTVFDPATQQSLGFFTEVPLFKTKPVSRAADFGSSFEISAEVTSAGPVEYIWRKDGVVIPGENQQTLPFINAGSSSTGAYSVTANTFSGSISAEFLIQIGPARGAGSPQPNALIVSGEAGLFQRVGAPPIFIPIPFPLEAVAGYTIRDSSMDRWGRLHVLSQSSGTPDRYILSSYYPALNKWVHAPVRIPAPPFPMQAEFTIFDHYLATRSFIFDLDMLKETFVVGPTGPCKKLTAAPFWFTPSEAEFPVQPLFGLHFSTPEIQSGFVTFPTFGIIQLQTSGQALFEPAEAIAMRPFGPDFLFDPRVDVFVATRDQLLVARSQSPEVPTFFLEPAGSTILQVDGVWTDLTVSQPGRIFGGNASRSGAEGVVMELDEQSSTLLPIALPVLMSEPYTAWSPILPQLQVYVTLPAHHIDQATELVPWSLESTVLVALPGEAEKDPSPKYTWSSPDAPSWMTVRFNGNQVTWAGTPPIGAASPTIISGQIRHGSGAAQTVRFRIDIAPGNAAPEPVLPEETVEVDEDSLPVAINPRDRFTDAHTPASGLSYRIEPLSGAGLVSSATRTDGSNLEYLLTIAANQHGRADFRITAEDPAGLTGTMLLHVIVRPVNDRPAAVAGIAATDEDTAVAITLAGTDIDGDTLTYTITTPPQHGSLTGTAPDMSYSPAANYHGADSFQFTVSDGPLTSEPVVVNLTVRPVNDRPAAVAGSAATDEDTAVAITLPGTDIDGDTLTYTITTPPQHGSLTGTAPDMSYSPSANYHGADSFQFTVSDGVLTSESVVVNLTVRPVNDRPAAVAGSAATDEDTAVAITLAGTDIDGDTLTYTITTPPQHGALTGTAPDMSYSPAANYHGADSFQFTVSDGVLTSEPVGVNLTVRPVNDRPAAVAGSAATDEDTATGITLAGTDIDGDTLTYTITTPPQHGSLTGTAPDMSYSPSANHHGADSFQFTVSDGVLTSEPVVVNLTVRSIPDAPQTLGLIADQTAPATGDLLVAAGTLFTDADGEPLQYTISGNTEPGITATVSVDGAGVVRIVFAEYSLGGSTLITVRATDPTGRSADLPFRVTLPAPGSPQIRFVQELKVNRQTGLLELVVDVTNLHTRAIGGFRASFSSLPANVCLYNGSDCIGGTPESVYGRPLQAGQTVRAVYQFYSPARNTSWVPQLSVSPLPAQTFPVSGGRIAIDRCVLLAGGSILLEFPSVPGALYQVEFMDPGAAWLPIPMQMRAAGTRLQWIDHGPPATPALPAGGKSRFYRVRAL